MHQAKKLCSNLVCLPYQFEEYERVSSHLYNVLLDCGADRIEAVSIDEALVDLTTACTNDDAIDIQSKALSISQNIRRRIYQLSGCTVSVGIGDNILQSKIATKLAKPDGQYYITAKESLDIIGSMDITDLPGVGYSTGALLKQHLPSINKIRDVRAVSLSSLKQILGEKTGIKIHRSSFGIDDREVGEVSARKSVGVEINWGVRLSTFDEVQKFIRSLATELFQRLQQLNITGKTLTLKVQNRAPDAPIDPPKYLGCGDCISYSRSASFSDESFSINDICNLSLNLILKMPVIVQDIRGIGLQITKLSNADECFAKKGQKSVSLYNRAFYDLKPEEYENSAKIKNSDYLLNFYSQNGSKPVSVKSKSDEIMTRDDTESTKHILKSWFLASLEDHIGPHEEDICLVERFLNNLILQRKNICEAHELVNWLEFQIKLQQFACLDPEDEKFQISYQWLQIIVHYKATIMAASKMQII